MTSGLELDTSQRPSRKPAGAVLDPGRDVVRPPSRRMRPEEPEPDEVEPSTHGAAMIIALGWLVFALVNVVHDHDGVEVVFAAAISSLVTYAIYWISGWFARHIGTLGFIFLGGWFQFVIGMVAQGVYQLIPIRWWFVGVAYVVVGVFAGMR